jgi:hypothetical protein
MMESSLYCYAWDLAGDAGRENRPLIDSLGLDAITLATSYHAGKFLRPNATASKVIFPEDGTVYFRPRNEYGALRPLVAGITATEDVLESLIAGGRYRVYGWTVLLHNSRLGFEHPEVVVRNAWGDPYYYSLCPAREEVKEYAVTLCADLVRNYGLAGLVLETPGFLPFAHGYHHEFAQIPANPWMDILLGLCFCDACAAEARTSGIEVAALARRLRESVQAYLSNPTNVPTDMAAHWLIADLVSDAEFTEFLRKRCEIVTRLVRAIRQEMPQSASLAVIPSVQRPSAMAWSEGSDLAQLARHCGLELPIYEAAPGRALADLVDCRRRAGAKAAITVILRPGHPDMTSKAQLEATISELAGQGVRGFSFYNFGLLRRHNLDWIRYATSSLRGVGEQARAP